MAKVFASLIRKGVITIDDVKGEEMRAKVQRILEEE